MKKPELLAPAGSMTMLRAAVDAGADAVYLGLNQYNARIHAANFTLETLREALEYAHLRNARIYVTLNTLLDEDELMDAVELALSAYKLGVDAFLVQDKGLASYLAVHFPQIPLHASTQMNVFSLFQGQEMQDLNMQRIVLPRELSLDEIRARTELWHERNMEVEVFVHGAMCVCYSGLCLFSSMNRSGSRSGNRGSCAQPCRQSYQIREGNRQVEAGGEVLLSGKLLSPKDQSALPYLADLMSIGVDSLKIEGRMRDEQYCTAVVSAYRTMIDAIYEGKDSEEVMQQVKNDLLVTFNRGGDFTSQYMADQKSPDYLSGEYVGKFGLYWGEILSVNAKAGTICVRSWQQDVPQKGDFLSIRDKNVETSSFPIGKIELTRNSAIVKGLHPDAIAKLRTGMAVYRMSKKIEIAKEMVRRTPIEGLFKQEGSDFVLSVRVKDGAFAGVSASAKAEAQDLGEGAPLTWERTREQLEKTGQTPFHFVKIKRDGDFPILLRISQINALRRDAMAFLAEAILDKSIEGRNDHYTEAEDKGGSLEKPEKTHILIADYIDASRITDGYACGADLYLFSALQVTRSGMIGRIDELLSQEKEAKVGLRLPGAYKDSLLELLNKSVSLMKSHAGSRFAGCFGTSPSDGTVGLLGGSNVYNHYTYQYASALNLPYIGVSYELSNEQIQRLAESLDEKEKKSYMTLHRYGPVEWMQSEFCPLGRNQKHCHMCKDHPEVTLSELSGNKEEMHSETKVDVVCYPGPCRSDLFGNAKTLVSSETVSILQKNDIPVASVARFMNEDRQERRMIMESLLDLEDITEDEEDWYEF